MPSLPSRLAPAFLRLAQANKSMTSRANAERHVAERLLRPRRYGPPRSLRPDVSVVARRAGGWPVYSLAPKTGETAGGVVYVHGGAWVNEIVSQHWHLAAQIAAEARVTVTVPIYPLVPFGCAEQVVSGVARLVLASTAQYGSTSLAGDSAGGQIALSSALELRDKHRLALPQTVLIAPGLDLSLRNPDIDLVQPSDPWLAREGTRLFIEYWRGDLPLSDPRVSPLAGNFEGLGPLTVFSGTRDILNPDTHLLVDRARAAGVDTEFHEGVGLVHVYPLMPTPEGRAARALIVDRLRGTRVGIR